MSAVDAFALISGSPVACNGVFVYPPTLGMIRDIGYDNYRSYLSLFLLSKADMLSMIGITDSESRLDSLSPIQLMTLIPDFRATLLGALKFFLRQEVCYTDSFGFFLGFDRRVQLPLAHILEIRKIILQLCRVEDDTVQEAVSFQSERARKTYEKILKHKAQKKKSSTANDADYDLSNLIGAVAAYSPTYSLLNIWELTVYQFYDQFERLSSKIQLDVIGQKWAAWGTEDFDFSVWFKTHKT